MEIEANCRTQFGGQYISAKGTDRRTTMFSKKTVSDSPNEVEHMKLLL
jgi:hypothetical protein